MSEQPAKSSADTPSEAESTLFTHKQILYVVFGLLMGIFLVSMEQTVMATSIRVIADDFGRYSEQAWVTITYLVTSTIVTPLYGKLSDIFGRKPCYLFSISLFMVGSLACAFAMSMTQLAIFRAVQGIGAGGLTGLSFTILGEIVAPRQRAKYQGYFLAVFTVSSVLGPLIGGLFSGADSIAGITGWRWVFLINVPLGLFGLAVVQRVLNLPRKQRDGVRIDWLGGLVLTVALAPLLVVAQMGEEWGWASVAAIVCIAVAIVGLVVFVLVERKAEDNAMIPLRIFGDRRFVTGTVLAFLAGSLMFATFVLLPQYFQVVLGSSATHSGVLLLPTIAGTIVGALVSGQIIARTGGYRVHTLAGAGLTVLGMFGLYLLAGTGNLWVLLPVTFALGLGISAFNQPITLVMQNILAAKDLGISTAAATFFRQIGGTIGIAVFLSLWFALTPAALTGQVHAASGQSGFRQGLAQAAQHASSEPARNLAGSLDAGNTDAVQSLVHNTGTLQALPDTVAGPLKQGFADSMGTVFLGTTIVALLALGIMVCWKSVPLRGKSAAQEMAKERQPAQGRAGSS